MQINQNQPTNPSQQVLNLQVTDGLVVGVIQDPRFEFLMSTKDVAFGYGVSPETIRGHLYYQKEELVSGQHYLPDVGISNGSQVRKQTMWTKAGVIRLGFFIKSERAKLFRDWAEKIILTVTAPEVVLPPVKKRNHNRLSQSRLVEILADVAKIENHQLRLSLLKKLLPEGEVIAQKTKTKQVGKGTLPLFEKGGDVL